MSDINWDNVTTLELIHLAHNGHIFTAHDLIHVVTHGRTDILHLLTNTDIQHTDSVDLLM